MKSVFLVILLAAAVALAGCKKQNTVTTIKTPDGKSIVTTTSPEGKVISVTTK